MQWKGAPPSELYGKGLVEGSEQQGEPMLPGEGTPMLPGPFPSTNFNLLFPFPKSQAEAEAGESERDLGWEVMDVGSGDPPGQPLLTATGPEGRAPRTLHSAPRAVRPPRPRFCLTSWPFCRRNMSPRMTWCPPCGLWCWWDPL